jgi:predicted phage-related endonuclease
METLSNIFMDVLNDIAEEDDDFLLPTNVDEKKPFEPIKGLRRSAPKILMDTGKLSHDEFSKARQDIQKKLGHTVFGGSDTGAILGTSSYTSAQELFHEKTTGENLRNNQGKSWQFLGGHESEDLIAVLTQEYWKKHGNHSVAIINDTNMYQCQTTNADGTLRYPFAVANLDRIILLDGKRGIMECKTVLDFQKQKALEKGIIPPEYESQCRYYMATTNLMFAIISFYWGPAEKEFRSFIIRRDFELEQNLMETVRDFWIHVERKQEPDFKTLNPLLSLSWYRRYYAVIDNNLPELSFEDKEAEVEAIISYNEQIKQLKAQIQEIEDKKNDIYADWSKQFGFAGIGSVELSDGSTASIERVISYCKQKLDVEKLSNDKPDLYKTYLTLFNEDAFKADYPELYDKYLEEKRINLKTTAEPFKIKTRKLKKRII